MTRDRYDDVWSKAKVALLSRNFLVVVIATVGMLPQLAAFAGYYIPGDITHQLLPFIHETKRMLQSGVPFWSWSTYFGDNFVASYAYYTVFNPFTWLNCLFPYRWLGLGFTLMLYLKFLLCGYVAQRYLKKMGFDDRLSLIGCLLYTFSSWAISNLLFYFFLEPMILFPLLLIFIERMLRKERHGYSGLALATFVVVTVNYYFAAVNLIAATIYYFCRLPYLSGTKNDRIWLTVKSFGCVSLGILSSSVVLIPVILQLRGYTDGPVDHDSTDIFMWADRLFWLVYPKAHEGRFFYLFLNSGWKSNAASIAVFGLLPAILLFTKKGFGWIKWLLGVLVVIYITPLNGLFSVFVDFYYTRWAYALTLAIIIGTLYYLKEFGMPKFSTAAWYCAVVYGLYFIIAGGSIFWQWRNGGEAALQRSVQLGMDVVLVAVNALALLVLCSGKRGDERWQGRAMTAVVICTALQFFEYSFPVAQIYGADGQELTETEYFRRGEQLHSDGDFSYRTNFTVMNTGGRPSSNFGLITNRPSISTYHSVQNGRIHAWNSIVGDSLNRQRVFYPRKHVRSFEALMSVKDLAIVSREVADTCPGKPLGRNDLFSMYESDHYIPMGFAYDSYILSDTIEALLRKGGNPDVPKILLASLGIESTDEKELSGYLRKGSINPAADLDSIVAARRQIHCDRFRGHSRGFDAHISLDSAAVVFFSVVADDGFTAHIDGEPAKIYETNLGFSSLIVPAGSHDITFRYLAPGLLAGIIFSALGLISILFMYIKRL